MPAAEPARQRPAPRCCPSAAPAPCMRWMLALWSRRPSTSSASGARSWSRRCCARASSASCPTATTSTPTSRRRYNPWDQRLCAGARRRPVHGHPARDAPRSSPTTSRRSPRQGLRLESGDELEADIIVTATGLEMLFLGGIERLRRRRDGRPAEPHHLQGHDARGRPQPRLRHRVHERVVDAEVRPHVRLRLPAAQPPPRQPGCASARRSTTTASVDRGADARPVVGLHPRAPPTGFPKQGSQFPWQVHQSYLRDYRALKTQRRRRRRDGVLEPRPPGPGRRARRQLKEPVHMKDFDGRVAAITGAGSGIGRALAIDLAGAGHAPGADRHRRGRPGRDRRAVRGAAASRSPRSASTWPTGPRSRRGPQQVVDDHGKVNLIFNNAGVALGATVEAMSYDDFEWLMDINFWGVVHGTKAFLPAPQGVGRGPRRQHLERLRAGQRPDAVGLQRGQVRGARLHRRAAHGARDRGRARVVPPPSTRAASRPTSPAAPASTTSMAGVGGAVDEPRPTSSTRSP